MIEKKRKSPEMLDFVKLMMGQDPEPVRALVEIYTKQASSACIRAKWLLCHKGVKYTEYRIDQDELAARTMAQRTGGQRDLPQIFINNRHIGGDSELDCLNREGKLDHLLAEVYNY